MFRRKHMDLTWSRGINFNIDSNSKCVIRVVAMSVMVQNEITDTVVLPSIKSISIFCPYSIYNFTTVNYTNLSPTIIHLEGSRLCFFLRRSNITEFGFPTIIGSFLDGIFMDPTIAPVPVGKIKIVRLLAFIYRCAVGMGRLFKLSNLNVYDWVLNFPLRYVNGWGYSRYNI